MVFKKHIKKGNVKFDDPQLEQKILKSNSSLIYQDIGSLISYVAHNSENPIEFVKDIPNVRSLKSNDLMLLFNIIQKSLQNVQGMSLDQQISFKQKVLKDSEKVLMLAASNLKTL